MVSGLPDCDLDEIGRQGVILSQFPHGDTHCWAVYQHGSENIPGKSFPGGSPDPQTEKRVLEAADEFLP